MPDPVSQLFPKQLWPLSPSQTYLGLPACDTYTTNITHAAETHLNVSWLFYARITVKPAQCAALHKMSGSESWQTFSTPHFDALHLTAFPSAVPLIFHIRHLIITASRTICFWTNLPPFQINISRQVKWHLSSLSIEAWVYNAPIVTFWGI